MLISGTNGLLSEGVQCGLVDACLVAQVAVQGFAAHEVDDLPRRVVGAGIVALVSLVEVLEDAAQQLWVGVDGLVVGRGLPGSESIAGEQAEEGLLLAFFVVRIGVEHLVRQGNFSRVVNAVLQSVPAEQAAVQIGHEAQDRVLPPAAASRRHRIEEHWGQDAAIVVALLRLCPLVPKVQQVSWRTHPSGFSQPALGLKEPEEEHPAHLAGGPGAGLLLAEGSDYGMVRVVGQQCAGNAVADCGVLLVEPGGDALNAELMLPQPGYFQKTRAGSDAQPLQEVPVEARGIVQVQVGADTGDGTI